MKISLIIKTEDPSQNGLLIAREMETQGEEVQKVSMSLPEEEIVNRVIDFKPEVVFGTHTHRHLSPTVISEIRKRTKALLVLWYVDGYGLVTPEEKQCFDYSKGLYNLMLVSVRHHANVLRSEGYSPNVVWIPQFYDPVFYGDPLCSLKERTNDICFIGNVHQASPDRLKFMEVLKDKGYSMIVRGSGFGNYALGKRASQVYLDSKIAFDVPKRLEWQFELCFSVRLFNAMANGCLFLTPPVSNLEKLFILGVDLDTYNGTVEDLCEKIDYYLRHEDERKLIAGRGQRKVLQSHTIQFRVEQYLRLIRKVINGEEVEKDWSMFM